MALRLTYLVVWVLLASVSHGQQVVYATAKNLVLRDRPEKKYNVFAVLQPRCPLTIDHSDIGYLHNKEVNARFYMITLGFTDPQGIHHTIGGWVEKKYVTTHGSTPADSTHFFLTEIEPGANPKQFNGASFPPPKYKGAELPPPPVKRIYHTGARGGCYYLTGKGTKVYVDKSHCKEAAPHRNK